MLTSSSLCGLDSHLHWRGIYAEYTGNNVSQLSAIWRRWIKSKPSSCCCLNQKQASWLTVLERWAKALMWSSSSYMISRSSPVLWPGLQMSTERTCHSEIFHASLLSSLLTNQKCLMRNESRLVGNQPWQMSCWCDGTMFQMMSQHYCMFRFLGQHMHQYISKTRENIKYYCFCWLLLTVSWGSCAEVHQGQSEPGGGWSLAAPLHSPFSPPR